MKRVFSVLLSAAVLASSLPVLAAEDYTAAADPGAAVYADGQNGTEEEGVLPYLNESLSFEERAADLVSRMTLEEKTAQLGYQAPAIERLGVAKYNYWRECLHGVARQGKATNFPAPLALSNTWNRELVYRVADITSTEARAKNNKTDLSYYTPTINMARDPRWGRNDETYGEDPYLTGQLGGEFVKGMQGNDEKYTKIIATIKHFAANNNEANRRGGSSEVSEFNFRNYYTKVFENVAEIEMPGSVMSSYNANTIYRNGTPIVNYLPSAANSYLLTDLLRRSWGFDGYVTTDCGAGEDLAKNASYKNAILGSTVSDESAYIAAALKAGMDLECSLGGGNYTTRFGNDAVEKGYISEEELETAVYHLFLQRFKTGEFDSAPSYRDIDSSAIETDANVAVAEEAAEESYVLLKNDNGFLPLKNAKKAVIVGDLANKLVLGDYTGAPTKNVTPAEGIKAELAAKGMEAEHIAAVADDEKLFNIKSITLVLKDGKTRSVDLSKAQSVSGMTASNGGFINVTPKAAAVIPNVNFLDVASVRVEMAQGSLKGGSLNIGYGSGGTITVASVRSQATADTDTYAVCEGEYTGEDGGYNGTADLSISASAAVAPFSVEAYKAELDAADVIIAYAATIPKQEGLGDPDSSESRDRSSIDLPAHQSHVQAICDAYPEKTVVAMSTVGQINVEPFINKCRAVLWTSYNGQTQGTALGRILTGAVNPSGHLSTTWYRNADIIKMELSNRKKQTKNGIEGYYTNYNIQPDGTNPGHTYQYYSNTPVYPFGYGMSYTSFEYSDVKSDVTEVDANGQITFTADVTNTGSVKGKAVAQLYIGFPAADSGTPSKQLKNFEKIELEPGETKTITLKLDARDLRLYSEKLQRHEVINGTYTAYIAANADDMSRPLRFDVSGTLMSRLKTVKTMPDGVTLHGLICEDGTGLAPVTKISARASAVMSDGAFCDMSKTAISYTSSDSSVAAVDENGVVSSGKKEGVAVITASVTVDGVTESDSFPVVNSLQIKPTDEEIAEAEAELQAAYDKLPAAAYSAAAKAELDRIFDEAVSAIKAVETKDELSRLLAAAVNDINSVPMDNLEESYTIESVNPKHIEKGVIDYRDGGIPMYSGSAGTVTEANPYAPIGLTVKDADGNTVTSDGLTWQIRKFDNSVRKTAEIDSKTGELTVYGNGIVQITAADIENLKCAKLMVQINMQIEGEYADNGNGADLTDAQKGASGGGNAGSTANVWMEYKSVKLSNLEGIAVRYAGKNDGQINISLDKSVSSGLIASANAKATGGWGTWAEMPLTINQDALNDAVLGGKVDQYGCATVYVQTNGVNLDYFRMNYIENNDDIPYIIEDVRSRADGILKVTLKYRGSTPAVPVSLAAECGGTAAAETAVCGTGEYELKTGAVDGSAMKLYVTDGSRMLCEPMQYTYRTPVDSRIVAYYLDSPDFDYTALSGGTDGTRFAAEVNGLCGYGSWTVKDKKSSYTYTDVNGCTYDFSFVKTWQAGSGNETKRSLYFTPESECKVTVLFNGAEGRDMYISQNGEKLATGLGCGADTAFSAEITDTSSPVYVYGGSSNKNLYAIIVEYYGKRDEPEAPQITMTYSDGVIISSNTDISAVLIKASYKNGTTDGTQVKNVTVAAGETTEIKDMDIKSGDKLMLWDGLSTMKPLTPPVTVSGAAQDEERAVQYIDWGSSRAVLMRNDASGETAVYKTTPGDILIPISTDTFYSKPESYSYGDPLTINSLAVYNGRLYAGCDGGYVIMFTDCAKCTKLFRPVTFDIKNMRTDGGYMYADDGVNEAVIDMSDIGGDSIEPDEAYTLAAAGAVFADVRPAEDFEKEHIEGAINVSLATLQDDLKAYDKDTVIIFYCFSGTRAGEALKAAKELGFSRVYNAGGYDRLL